MPTELDDDADADAGDDAAAVLAAARRMQVTSYELQATSYKLQVTSCCKFGCKFGKLQVTCIPTHDFVTSQLCNFVAHNFVTL